MRFHGRLSDTSLAGFFMVYKRRVIAIYNQHKAIRDAMPDFPWATQTYDHWQQTPQYTVQMRILGDDVWVTLIGSNEAYFEFQTTAFPVDLGTFSGFPAYYAAVISTAVGSRPPKGVLQGTGKELDTSTVGPLFRNDQVQLHDELNGHPIKSGSTYPRTLYESFAPVSSHSGMYGRAYHCGWLPFSYDTLSCSGVANETRDYGYDNPWADSLGKTGVRYAYLGGTTDWPRASGIQMVKDSIFGDLEFAIYVDSFDQVSVFPTQFIGPNVGSDFIYGADIQNVPAKYVQTQRVPLPDWVYKKTQRFKDYFASNSTVGLNDFPEIDWKVHPAGTEMCAVVHERHAAVFDSGFFAPYAVDTGTQGPSFMYPDATSFYTMNWEAFGCYQRLNGVKPSTAADPWYMIATGLLQVKIAIKRTGLLPEQYELSLAITELRRPTTTPYCTFVAGYAFYDLKDLARSTPEVSVFHSKRGDIMALDIECWGDTATGNTANLYSLKNITQGREINTFGGMNSVSTNPVVDIGTMLTGQEAVLLASDMRTLSFAFRTATNAFDDKPVNSHETMHFGIAVIVMNKYQRTLYPNSTPVLIKQIIDSANSNDARVRMNAQMPGMTLMPLNDLREWGDPDLDSLRESYVWTTLKQGTYTPPIQPLDNFGDIQTHGYKFYRNGARLTASVSAATQMWYDSLMTQGGIKPFPIFDIDKPRPGWYLYMGQIISRFFQTPWTAFFSHPDGSWALFDQQFIYNANGMYRDGTITGPGYNSCDPNKLEHCIFDVVHFASSGSRPLWETSFLKLYNQAITNYVTDNTIPQNLKLLDPTYKDMRITFKVNPKNDSVDPTLQYAEIEMTWYPGFTFYYVERWYWTGSRSFGIGFESQSGGGFQLFSLAHYAQLHSGDAASVPPLSNNTPIKFSSAVMISLN